MFDRRHECAAHIHDGVRTGEWSIHHAHDIVQHSADVARCRAVDRTRTMHHRDYCSIVSQHRERRIDNRQEHDDNGRDSRTETRR